MFWPASMRHVNIFVLQDDVLRVTVALGKLGVLHLAQVEESSQWERGGEDPWSERADQYASLERELGDLLDVLEIPREAAPAPEVKVPEEQIEDVEALIDEVRASMEDWEARRAATEDEIRRLHLLEQEAEAIRPLDIPVERFRAMEHLHLVVGSLPQENLERLQMVLFTIPFVVVPIYEHDDRVFVFAVSARHDAAVLDRALESALLERLELPEGVTGSPAEALEELHARLEAAQRRLDELEEERKDVVNAYRERLLSRWTQMHYDATVLSTVQQYGRHEDAYLITGWVPAKDLERLVSTVDETAEKRADIEVLEAVMERDPQTPTLLQNPKILQPFQRVLSIFGLPAYDQVDPTPIVAVTFVIMYGMMFGDVGHGLVLALIGLWFLRNREGGIASLAPVLVAAGSTGAVFGLLYGSLFGREDILPHLWLSPLQEVMTILIVSVGAGVALLNIGFLLHVASAYRSRDWGGLLLSANGVAGIALYWALLGGGVLLVQGVSIPIALWIVAILVPLVLILAREPLLHWVAGERPLVERGWVTYGVRAFFELFEAVIGYFTNSVSFVRLGAFAVAHAALGQVLYIMADLAGGVGRWLVIVLGTVIIIGFEGMVVGIQALRLEYYEFFDKFFEGEGRRYTPFQLPQRSGS